jgi:membrane-bound serine protease (ClpP class)
MFALVLAWSNAIAMAQTMPATAPATTNAARATTAIIRLRGTVDDYGRDALKRRFSEARTLGATTIVLEVDTYGGAVSSALDISRFIKQQDGLHTIAFVSEKAISAGVMIALAADELVMAPGAMIGDSAPISMRSTGELQPLPTTERAKVESPILADFYDSAVRNGYEPALTAAMVSVGHAVYWIESSTGERKFVSAADHAKLTAADWKDVPGVPVPIDSPETLLTIGADLAAKIGLAKAIYPSVDAMVTARGLNVVATLTPQFNEKAIEWLGGDILRGLLLTVFTLSIYAALHTPGTGAPEALATICLGMLLGVPLLTGDASWWEVAIIFVGLALIALEIFVIPGFGIPGITGLVMLFGGLLMTFVPIEPGRSPFSLPSLGVTWQAAGNGVIVIGMATIVSGALAIWMRRFLPTMPYFRRLILTDVAGGAGVMATNPALGDDVATWPTLQSRGYAVSDLRPSGVAKFYDEAVGAERVVNVVSDSGFVPAGCRLRVREVAGNRVLVRPFTEDGATA